MTDYILEIGKKAREAACRLAGIGAEDKTEALMILADELIKHSDEIVEANKKDLDSAEKSGMSESLKDRLRLDSKRISAMAEGIRNVAVLPDPVGRVLDDYTRPNGLHITKVAVPIGVIAVIYEARPNVTSDSAALCLKSGNVVILRGGKEAINSNIAVSEIMRNALSLTKIPSDVIQLIKDTSHETATELMHANGYVDVLIPRGGKGLIQAVVHNSSVPVIETGAGVCHAYVDKNADLNKAVEIIYNAKTSRPSVCNALECMLIHSDVAEDMLPEIVKKLDEKNVEVRGDERTCKILGNRAVAASDEDFGYEFGDYIIACRIVDSVDEAIEHIRKYSTGHSESIITEDNAVAEHFLSEIDSAAVYHNVSTRFTDGGEFGMGAEIGISTQKLHARGPLGLKELTSMKYIIRGNGQVR